MNKLKGYINTILIKPQSFYMMFILLLVYNLGQLSDFLKHSVGLISNFYDFFISTLGNFLVLAYFIPFIFILTIFNIGNKNNFYQYMILKFKSRNNWYNTNICILILTATLFVLGIWGVSILVSLTTFNFANQWSEYSIHMSKNMVKYIQSYDINIYQYIIQTISPFKYMLFTVCYIILYLCVIGLSYFILSIIFKKSISSLVVTFIIILLNIMLYRSESVFAKKISFFYNIILIDPNAEVLNCFVFYQRLLYWILLMGILYFCGAIVTSKIDFNFEGRLK